MPRKELAGCPGGPYRQTVHAEKGVGWLSRGSIQADSTCRERSWLAVPEVHTGRQYMPRKELAGCPGGPYRQTVHAEKGVGWLSRGSIQADSTCRERSWLAVPGVHTGRQYMPRKELAGCPGGPYRQTVHAEKGVGCLSRGPYRQTVHAEKGVGWLSRGSIQADSTCRERSWLAVPGVHTGRQYMPRKGLSVPGVYRQTVHAEKEEYKISTRMDSKVD